MPGLGFLQDLLMPGMAGPAPAPVDPAEEAIKAGTQRMMGDSPLAPQIEQMLRSGLERQRAGAEAEAVKQRGFQRIADFLGPQAGGALGLSAQPPWSAGQPAAAEPAVTEADLMALQGAPLPVQGSQSLGLSLPPGTDLSQFNRDMEGLRGLGAKAGEAAGKRKEAIGGSLKAQQAAAEKQAKIAADQQAKIASELTDLEGALAGQQQAQQDREAEVRKSVKAKTDAFTQAVEAANSASIDPDRWYRDSEGGTFGKRLGSAVAMALGAMGAAFLKGGPNYAMQIIESAINRDLMAQRAEMAKKQAGVGNASSAVALAREQFSDEKARGAAEQAAMLSRAQRMIAIATAQSGSEEEIAKGEALSAALGAKAAERMAEIDQAETAREWNSQTQLAGMDLEGAKIKGADAKLRWQAQAAASKAGLAMPPGLRIADPSRPPPSKAQLEAAQKTLGAFTDLRQSLAGLMAERKASGTLGRFTPKGDVLLKRAVAAISDLHGLSAEAKGRAMEKPEVFGLSDISDVGFVTERLQTLADDARGIVSQRFGALNLALDDVQAMGGARRVK